MSHVRMTHQDSSVDEIRQVRQRIAQRAYDLFRRRDAVSSDEWTDWFTAEQELGHFPHSIDVAKARATQVQRSETRVA